MNDRTGFGWTLVFASVALLVAACSGGGEKEWIPEHATLVFMSSRDGNAEIYTTVGVSSEWENLTRSEASENWPEWSPDGRRIAYQSNQHGKLDVWVMNADGSGAKRLTDDPAHDYLPSWSPDGTKITFASWRRESGDEEESVHIYVMNADGSGQRRLFDESPGTSTSPQWDPRGERLLLSRTVGEQGSDLFIVDLEGDVIRRLTNDAFSNGAAVFSPDGKHIAFYCDRGAESDIVVMSVDGSDRRTIVTGGRSWYPRWSPDGRWLTYTAEVPDGPEGDLDLRAVRVDGTSVPVTLVSGPGREAEGRWRSGW